MDGWLLVPTEQGHTALRWDWIREFRDTEGGHAEIRYAPPNEPGGIMRIASTMSTKQLLKGFLVSSAEDRPIPYRDYRGITGEGWGVTRPPIEQIKELLRDHGWAVIGSHENDAGVLSFHVFGRTK